MRERIFMSYPAWCRCAAVSGALVTGLVVGCSIDASDHATDNRTTGTQSSSGGSTSATSRGSGGGGSGGDDSSAANTSDETSNTSGDGSGGDGGSGGTSNDTGSGGDAGAAGAPSSEGNDGCSEPNDQRRDACAIGDLTSAELVPGVVNSSDDDDYYELEMLENGILTYGIDDTSGWVRVRLFEDTVPFDPGTPYHDAISTAEQRLESIVLEKGIYVLRVQPGNVSSSASYDLVVSVDYYDEVEPTPEPGEVDEALIVGSLPELQTYGGYVGGTDPLDDYRVTVPGDGRMGVRIDDVEGNVQALVVDATQFPAWESPLDGVVSSESTGGDGTQHEYALGAGDYYVRVRPSNPSAHSLYTLTLFTPAD